MSAKGSSSLSGRTGAVRWTFDSDGGREGAVDAVCWDAASADVVTLTSGEVRSVNGATGKVNWMLSKDMCALKFAGRGVDC